VGAGTSAPGGSFGLGRNSNGQVALTVTLGGAGILALLTTATPLCLLLGFPISLAPFLAAVLAPGESSLTLSSTPLPA
jgi:hypothetical protein